MTLTSSTVSGNTAGLSGGGIYNDVTWAQSPEGWGNLEHLVTLDTFTWPSATREWVDGVLEDDTEVAWGHVRPGLGLGYRRQVGPAQDNMLAAHFVGEVGSLYFGRGDRTPASAAPMCWWPPTCSRLPPTSTRWPPPSRVPSPT